MTADVDKLTHRLASATQRLRENSDRLSTVIRDFDQRLQEINPGVVVWLDSPEDLLEASVHSESIGDVLDRLPFVNDSAEQIRESCRQGDVVKYRVGTQLGFGRNGRDWQVLVRDARESYLQGELRVVEAEGRNYETLASASRAIRLAAAAKLPKLADAIAERVEQFADELEQGLAPFEKWVAKFGAQTGNSSKGGRDDDEIPF